MTRQALLTGLLALAIGAGGGYWWATQQPAPGEATTASTTAPEQPRVLFYRNPMNPEITSPVPAQDEMGMDYIPVYAQDGAQDDGAPAGTVSIDPVTVQNIGVRRAKAGRQVLGRAVRAVARIDYDEERLARLHPKTEGWIEKLLVDTTGERITRDTILLHIYSPKLVTTQQEYLLALDNLEALKDSPYDDIRQGAKELVASTRERLELLDVPEHQIHELHQTHKVKKTLHLHSPFDGVIVRIGAREGQYVTPETELYTIADLSRVWVLADVYENELPWIQVGDPVDMRLTALRGRRFAGQVAYIYPYAEAKTRTVKVRMVFDNPDALLKPDMFADVSIEAQRKVDALVIPDEAVVRSGEREQVFVVREPGRFEPREVTLGVSSDGLVQVVSGLDEGEEVVTSSQFLIDSESRLREATAKMRERAAGDAQREGGHDTHTH